MLIDDPGSPLASSLVFVAAFIPNLVMSPIAGTLVDRWDRREVLIVSDLLRAAIVLLIPMAIVLNVLLVYPLVFVMTSISIFFRPARAAILPQIVRKDELVTANSALWVGETLGDVVGFPLAALFVAALGSAIPVAFWLDAATYIGSALLLSTLVVHAIEPRTRRPNGSGCDHRDRGRPGVRGGDEGRLRLPARRRHALRQHDPGTAGQF